MLVDSQILQQFGRISKDYDCCTEAEQILDLDTRVKRVAKCLPTFSRLVAFIDKFGMEDWDGRGALPVSIGSIKNAFIFLMELPYGVDCPDPGICPNGNVTLEWRRDDGRLLSIAFDDTGNLNYILFLNSRKRLWGLQRVSSGYDEDLMSFLYRVMI